jgi:small subunit ribosomal protein S20
MAHHKSVLKDIRRNAKRNLRNRAIKTQLKNEFKKFDGHIEAGETEKAQEQFSGMCQMIDKAVTKGVIHKSVAARRKSRINRRIHRAASSE